MNSPEPPKPLPAYATHEPEQLLKSARRTVLAVVMIALGFVTLYLFKFHSGLSNNPERWGQTGDYFGGILNPVIGLATVILVFITARIQYHELRASKTVLDSQLKSTAQQNLEQTLFAWLKNYHDLLGSFVHHNGAFEGRKALHELYRTEFSSRVLNPQEPVYKSLRLAVLGGADHDMLGAALPEKEMGMFHALAMSGFEVVYRTHEYQLDCLFRTIYRLFLWIDQHPSLAEDPEQKWFYASLVRAQLSWIELTYLFYNGCTSRGENFVRLCNRYALFDNLNLSSDNMLYFMAKRHECNPYSPAAFDSEIARRELWLTTPIS